VNFWTCPTVFVAILPACRNGPVCEDKQHFSPPIRNDAATSESHLTRVRCFGGVTSTTCRLHVQVISMHVSQRHIATRSDHVTTGKLSVSAAATSVSDCSQTNLPHSDYLFPNVQPSPELVP
jgi:hypothetical protein